MILMKKLTLISIVFVIAFQACKENPKTKPESINKIIEFLVENKTFNGAALVVDNVEVIYNKAFGNANMEWNIPNTPDTKFEIGSVTKQFTAMLIMQLVADNKIITSDTIGKYLPEIFGKFGKITIHQLLTHTSGLPGHATVLSDYLKIHLKVPYTFEERVEQIKNFDYEFTPDSSWSYNGFGYSILGEIIVKITDKSLEENYAEKIFNPLGMNNSGSYFNTKLVEKIAYGYQQNWENNFIPPVFFAKTNTTLGGGGLYSTTEDLLKWHNALQNNTLLPDELMKIYFGHHFQFSDNDGYCYGNYYDSLKINEKKSLGIYSHGGSLPGNSSLIFRVPESNQCIILLTNGGMGHEQFLYTIATEIMNILYNEEFHMPKLSLVYPLIYTAFFADIDVMNKQYFFLKENAPDAYVFEPEQLNIITMVLMQYNMMEYVEGILKLNIDEYPEDYSVYSELGKFYAGNEDNELALEYLNKALVLSKDNMEIINMIKEIKESVKQKR